MKYRNTIEYTVYGRYALFTDPITKTGGEKFSYPIPTYQALVGITESIYWKPTFHWVIDDVRIMNQIKMQQQGMRPIHYQNDKNDLSIYTYLKDVEYQVRAHFEWNENREDLAQDRNENKHWDIAKRSLAKGGRRDIFLGTRECQGYVEPVVFGTGASEYDNMSMSFGVMVHGLTYPDQAYNEETKDHLSARLWNPVMENGIIHFIRPEECTMTRVIDERHQKKFVIGENISIEGDE
ncbi:MAG: type I-C CRISPR-associated protein Cas5c [Holdemanella porci]|uniref:type I-C CRISPR-associated protein Cas5c n=1 Tax=Holdemanella porci TaxID=2652276 RepID=UPI00243024F0|nr:type I-C CRISPR-associated protein Cas5c [Holdemanella porci]MDD6453474.1 type I-C CRISPR-associated protein Cas5c [Holdemanella porci]